MSNTVYVDTDSLIDWKNNISKLNEDAELILKDIIKDITSLDSYWKGNAADSFITSSERLLKSAIDCHNQMKNVDRLLVKVVDVVENE